MEELNKKEQKILEEGIAYSKKKELLGRLQHLETTLPDVDTQTTKKSYSIKLWQKWSIAASIAILLGVGWWMFTPDGSAKIFTDEIKPYPRTDQQRTDVAIDLKTKALSKYGKGNYKKAVPLLEELDENGDYDLSQLYLGIAYLGNRQLDAAIDKLKSHKSKFPEWTNQTNLYLALAYRQKGDVKNIVELIKPMEDSIEKTKIENLLEQMNMKKE